MSSYWAGYSGTALVLRENEFSGFLEKYKELHKETLTAIEENEESVREYPFLCSCSIGKENVNIKYFYIVDVLQGECDGMCLYPYIVDYRKNSPESPVNPGISLRSENVYVVFADHQLDSVDTFFHRPYESYNALVQEFKDKLEKYLPANFNWDLHTGHFSYAAYA